MTLPRSSPPVTPLYPYLRYDLSGRRPLAAHEPELPQLPSASAGGADPVSSGASVSPDHLITVLPFFWRDRDVVGQAAAMLVRPSVVHSVVGSGTSGLPAGLRVAAAARRRRSGLPALCCNCAVLVLLQMHAQPVPYGRSGRLQSHNRLRHGAFGRARVRCRAGSAHDARSNNNCYKWQQPLLLVDRVPREVQISRRS